jgi:hypothetical protein
MCFVLFSIFRRQIGQIWRLKMHFVLFSIFRRQNGPIWRLETGNKIRPNFPLNTRICNTSDGSIFPFIFQAQADNREREWADFAWFFRRWVDYYRELSRLLSAIALSPRAPQRRRPFGSLPSCLWSTSSSRFREPGFLLRKDRWSLSCRGRWTGARWTD